MYASETQMWGSHFSVAVKFCWRGKFALFGHLCARDYRSMQAHRPVLFLIVSIVHSSLFRCVRPGIDSRKGDSKCGSMRHWESVGCLAGGRMGAGLGLWVMGARVHVGG